MGIGTTPGSRAVKELLTSLPWENFGVSVPGLQDRPASCYTQLGMRGHVGFRVYTTGSVRRWVSTRGFHARDGGSTAKVPCSAVSSKVA